MTMAEYVSELKNTLFKINKQSWTLVSMLDANNQNDDEAGEFELETLAKAKAALVNVTEVFGRL